MKENDLIAQMTDLLTRQDEAEKLIGEAKEREIIFIKERYKDVLLDYHETDLLLNSIVAGFIQLCDENPEEGRSDDSTEQLQEACNANYEQMEDLREEFHAKWGNRYEEYEQEVAEVNVRYDRLLVLVQNPAAFHMFKGKKNKR